MFLLDPLREITGSLRTHKARTALAVLTVAWGIFMLVLLLGAGRGFQNGVDLQFRDDAINTIRTMETISRYALRLIMLISSRHVFISTAGAWLVTVSYRRLSLCEVYTRIIYFLKKHR